MPFCEACSRYWTPTAMSANGSCPGCGRALETSRSIPRDEVPTDASDPRTSAEKFDLKSLAASGGDEAISAPWHFKLLVACLALYLGWRVVDLFV